LLSPLESGVLRDKPTYRHKNTRNLEPNFFSFVYLEQFESRGMKFYDLPVSALPEHVKYYFNSEIPNPCYLYINLTWYK